MVWAPVPETVHEKCQYLHSLLAAECPLDLTKRGSAVTLLLTMKQLSAIKTLMSLGTVPRNFMHL